MAADTAREHCKKEERILRSLEGTLREKWECVDGGFGRIKVFWEEA